MRIARGGSLTRALGSARDRRPPSWRRRGTLCDMHIAAAVPPGRCTQACASGHMLRLAALSPGAQARAQAHAGKGGASVAQIGLRQAARLSGRNQSTLHRAMKAGRLSYTVDAAGQRRIDTAELDRVFGVNMSKVDKLGGVNGASSAHAGQSNTAHAVEHAALERLLADREASIADLRGRLDASEAERRQLSERLHGLLTAPGKVLEPKRFPPPGSVGATEQPPGEPPAGNAVLDTAERELRRATEPSASSGLAIPRPPWWRRWFR
jgi:hypothetical protein